MRFHFDQRKTAQAAAFLVQLHGGRLNYMKLIKLLYLADRHTLVERGLPITGDAMVAMPHGMVLSRTLNLINEGPQSASTDWYAMVTPPANYEVSLSQPDPDLDRLSRYELRVLRELAERFQHMDQWDLKHYTHELPEYVDPNGSSISVDPTTILAAEGITADDMRRVAQDAEELWRMGQLAKQFSS